MAVLIDLKPIALDVRPAQMTPNDYKGAASPVWCAGCGDYAVLSALRKACADLMLMPHDTLVVSDIGCSSNLPGYFNAYGMHTLHGRALPSATGAKLANHRLNVIATVGDGGTYGSGGNHLAHTARRNVDLTCIVMNNQVYGLTSGQISPTGRAGMKTRSTPFGSNDTHAEPIGAAIVNGATFVARGFSGSPDGLAELFKMAISHRGFALVDVLSPCPPFNCDSGYDFFEQRIRSLEDEGHDTTNKAAASDKAAMWDGAIYTGVFYRAAEDSPVIGDWSSATEDGVPPAHRSLGLSSEQARKVIDRMM